MVIPVTVLVTFIALKLLGQSFNLMTLGGLAAAVGLVIDDAIVVVENVALHRERGRTAWKPSAALCLKSPSHWLAPLSLPL